MKTFLQLCLALIVATILVVRVCTPPKTWWIKVGGIRGEKARVHSEIDGIVQEAIVVIPSTLRVSVDKQMIDYRITKTMGSNQDLWIEVSGPGRSGSYWAWWNNLAGLRVSIKKSELSVMKIGYRNFEDSRTGE
jgi:hypothetical protein